MSFRQPEATPVQVHLIEDVRDWESLSPGLVGILRPLDGETNGMQSTISQQASIAFSDDTLDRCMRASALVVKRLLALSDAEKCLPHLGRDPRTTIIGPFAMDILKEVIPESQARPPQSSAEASDGDDLGRSTDDQGSVWQQESEDDNPRLTYETSPSSGTSSNGERRPLGNAHLLSRHEIACDNAALAIFCVAAEDEIYDLMCSALMQHNSFGIRDVLIGLTFSPQRCHLQLVVGWLEDSATHACVQVHVAHARAPLEGGPPSHALGIFDLSQLHSSWALVLFLLSARAKLLASVDSAPRMVIDPRCPLRNTDSKTWRIDLLHESEADAVETCMADFDQSVRRWLGDCMPCTALDPRSTPPIPISPPNELGRSRDPRAPLAPSLTGTLHGSDNEGDLYVWHDPELRREYLKIREASIWDAPMVTGVRNRGYRNPSSLAASKCAPNRVDRLTEFFIDRGVSFDAFPAIFYILEGLPDHLEPLVKAWQDLILPRICDATPLSPSEFDPNVGCPHSALNRIYMEQWHGYNQEKALEQIVRSGHKLQLLTEVEHTTREIIARALPQVLSLSEVTARGSLDVPVEMESRQTWDAVIYELLGGLAGEADVELDHAEDKSNGFHRLVPYRTHSRLERRIYSPKNGVFETTLNLVAKPHSRYITKSQVMRGFASVFTDAMWREKNVEHLPPTDQTPRCTDPQPGLSDEELLISRLIVQTEVVLDRHVHAVDKALNVSTWSKKATNYLILANTSTEDTLAARAFCDFEYSICDGVVFVEIPDVFNATDCSFAEELDGFAVIGDPKLSRQANMKEVDDANMEPAPDDKLPPSCPEIVIAVREFVAELQKTRMAQSHAGSGESRAIADYAEHSPGDSSASGGNRSLEESLSNVHVAGSTQESSTSPTAASNDLPPPAVVSQEDADSNVSHNNEGVASKTAWTSVCLPILFREYKRSLVNPLQGMNQARIYILSATAFYASLDMYGVVVFAVATVGSKGRLLCGWAEKAPEGSIPAVVHRIIDSNCPEWDLGNSSDAIDFATFLALLRTKHIPDVVARFEATREAFVNDWRNGNRERFHWTLADQKNSELCRVAQQAQQENSDRYQVQMDLLKTMDQKAREDRVQLAVPASSSLCDPSHSS
ncbi:hypothetical protein C8Q77DRAFT_1158493 [Trametes polyzona]|nr:hypothetical protein C8Q77DRAFT_1158493 [Trametes polyzona]